MTVSERATTRLDGLDAVKGVCILMVVLIHAGSSLDPGPYRDLVVRGVARLAVPLFIVVSGLLAGLKETQRPRFATYFRKFLRLHVIYGLFYGGVAVLRSGLPASFTLKDAALLFGQASYPGQYYFLILIEIYFVAAFLAPARFWTSRAALGLSAAVAVAALTARGWALGDPFVVGVLGPPPLAGLSSPVLSMLVARVHVVYWLYYFALGAHLGARMSRRDSPPASGLAVALLGAAALALASLGVPLPLDDLDPEFVSYLRPRIYIATTLVALCLPGLAPLRVRGLARLGRESFGVYVFNPAMLFLLFDLFGRPASAPLSLLYFAAATALAFALTRLLRPRAPWLFV